MDDNKLAFNLLLSIMLLLLAVASGLYVCDRWGVQSEPCAINAPMEQAQCRAEFGTTAFKLFNGYDHEK